MNQMEIFKNPEFGSIRVIEENGKYLFSGTDVAAALGYSCLLYTSDAADE